MHTRSPALDLVNSTALPHTTPHQSVEQHPKPAPNTHQPKPPKQTDEGKREAHSPEMRPFSTFQAVTPYAEALSAGLRALNFRRHLNHFNDAETMAANVATESAEQAPSVKLFPSTGPDAAKYERGHWFYRLTFSSRKGSTTRWFPSTRYSPSELEEMAPLRTQWTDNLHRQDLPGLAVVAVIAAAAFPFQSPVELTLNAHLLRCAHTRADRTAAISAAFPVAPDVI